MMRIQKNILAAAMAAFLLVGCGGGDTFMWPVPERQFGVTEALLLDVPANPDGLVVGAGSGLVVTQIEPLAGLAAPLVGDSASIGVDQMWFDVDNLVKVALDLGSDSFDVVYKVEVLNQAENVLLTIDRAHPKGELWLDHGRYQLRFTAAITASDIALGMVWFGGASKLVDAADLQEMATTTCNGCNLRGANLSNLKLSGVVINSSDLREALLLKIPGGLALNGSLFKVLLGLSDVQGADLSGSALNSTDLSGAYLTGASGNAANLHGATLIDVTALNMFLPGADMGGATVNNSDFSGSVLTRADFTGAVLINAKFTDADLRGADFTGAMLTGVDFSNAQLTGATGINDSDVCVIDLAGACL